MNLGPRAHNGEQLFPLRLLYADCLSLCLPLSLLSPPSKGSGEREGSDFRIRADCSLTNYVGWLTWTPPLHQFLSKSVHSQHEQFAVDERRAPNRNLSKHTEDEVAYVLWHLPSPHASPNPRNKSPILPEARPMPANDDFRCDDDQGPSPPGPDALNKYTEEPVEGAQSRPRVTPFENGKLLAQGDVFE